MLAIIAAHDKNRGIGREGHMPWHIPGEQRRFRKLTTGAAVVMGRRTWEEIGHPLPNRLNIVLTRNPDFQAPGCLIAQSLAQAIALAGKLDVCIAGGAEVYAQALPLAERLYLTEIDAAYPADTFFPTFDESLYVRRLVARRAGPVPYAQYTYIRKDPAFANVPLEAIRKHFSSEK